MRVTLLVLAYHLLPRRCLNDDIIQLPT